jgi:hypothetical protein
MSETIMGMKLETEGSETDLDSYILSFLYLKDSCMEDLNNEAELELKKPKVLALYKAPDLSDYK